MYRNYIKIFFDIVTSLIVIIVLSPLIIIVWLGLVIVNKGHPFFFQLRPGKDEILFKIVKFRTMNNQKDENGILLQDKDRLTFLGKIVRKTSLDEIPQLFNVIWGQMSIVGPRPLLPEYLPLYTSEQKKRHLVKPGITGLAQVKGRNQMVFSERFKKDVEYVENQSFILDLKILVATVKQVLFRSKDVVLGQTVDEIDDIGISRNLDTNHFKNKK